MEPTIKVGDRLLAFKLAYDLKIPFTDLVVAHWGSPKRGDIIVFRYPKNLEIDYVKRVVGVAGDEIQIIDDNLYINGQLQARQEVPSAREVVADLGDPGTDQRALFRENLFGAEHWIMLNRPTHGAPKSNWPPLGAGPHRVRDDSVFVMGDNRDNSNDSRIWGEVPLSYVQGKAEFVIWSVFSPPDPSVWSKVRWNRFGYRL